MQSLKHPNLMPVVHVDVGATPPFYVMPYCNGVTLDARLRQGALAPLEVVKIARDAAFGLSEAARRGILHRDIKPSNLFLDDTGRTRVLDFGLAKALDDGFLAITQQGMLIGTPAYMAPEQCRGEAVTDRTDVYSLGVTIIELILGKNPFRGPDVVSTLARHLTATPRRLDALLPPRVPRDLGEVVHRMIAKAPETRPAMESCLETFAGVHAGLERAPNLKAKRA